MLDEVLLILKNKLNSHFKILTSTTDDKVVFPDSSKTDSNVFPQNNITLTLVNIEEEKLMRQAGIHESIIKNGLKTDAVPTVNINLRVLMVSRFSDYGQSLKFLSLIIAFFQKLPLLTPQNTPDLPPNLSRLKIELVTQTQAQQNEIWSGLRTAYLPSILYKVGILVFKDDTAGIVATPVRATGLETKHL